MEAEDSPAEGGRPEPEEVPACGAPSVRTRRSDHDRPYDDALRPQCLYRPAPAVRCEETAVYAGTAGAVPSLDVAEAERSRHVPPPLGTFGDLGGRLPSKRAPPGRTLGHDVGPLPQNLGEEGGGRGTGQERAHPGAEP